MSDSPTSNYLFREHRLRLLTLILIYISGYTPLWLIFLLQNIPLVNLLDEHAQQLVANNISLTPVFWDYVWVNNEAIPFYVLLFLFLISGYTILALRKLLGDIKTSYPPQKIISVNNISGDLLTYTLPYIASLVGLKINDPAYALGFMVFFIFMFVVNVKTETIFNNPILALLNYNLYSVTIKDSENQNHDIKLLAKAANLQNIPPLDVKIEKMSDNMFIMVENK